MPSLPSNYQTILNMETKPFEEHWPLLGRLLGLDSDLNTEKSQVDFYKDDLPVMTIHKAGGIEVFVNGNDEFIKKVLIASVKEVNKHGNG